MGVLKFSQNVGLTSIIEVMSRAVATTGAIYLIICSFVPKVGAIIAAMPISVLGGGVIVVFCMVASAGMNMLDDIVLKRRT